MTMSQNDFTAQHYAPRAEDYVTSQVHAAGEDLDQVEAMLRAVGATRLLDLGCGGGHVSYRAAPFAGEVIAADVTARILDVVARTASERGLHNVTTRQAAAEILPFDDAFFDVVICRFSAHHWQDMEAGLRQARRVLAAGGRAMFIDTIAPADPVLDTHLQAVELLRDASHVRNYDLAEWSAALGRAGFCLTGVTPRRLRMDFPTWIARTRTPPHHAEAIRSLQKAASDIVQNHFAIEADGSFMIDSVSMTACAAMGEQEEASHATPFFDPARYSDATGAPR
jgi:SAM-dependent methyltransferase